VLLASAGLERRHVRAARPPLGSGRRLRPARTRTRTRLRLPLRARLRARAPARGPQLGAPVRPVRHPTDGASPVARRDHCEPVLALRPAGGKVACDRLSEGKLPPGLLQAQGRSLRAAISSPARGARSFDTLSWTCRPVTAAPQGWLRHRPLRRVSGLQRGPAGEWGPSQARTFACTTPCCPGPPPPPLLSRPLPGGGKLAAAGPSHSHYAFPPTARPPTLPSHHVFLAGASRRSLWVWGVGESRLCRWAGSGAARGGPRRDGPMRRSGSVERAAPADPRRARLRSREDVIQWPVRTVQPHWQVPV
jgi:hypothetical protein